MTASTSKNINYLDEPAPGRLNIQYTPNLDSEIVENPPRFMWLPVVEEDANYVLRISTDKNFPADKTTTYSNIALNFLTPDEPLKSGKYFWSYAEWNSKTNSVASNWSQTRGFKVPKSLPEVSLPNRQTRFKSMSQAHPRLWLNHAGIENLRTKVKKDPSNIGWSDFMEKSVDPWLQRPVMAEPKPYPNNQRTAPIWRQTYIDCQELLYAIRHQSVAGKVLQDEKLVANAKAWLMAAASWDPDGTTSRSYTDEWAFRVTLALAWGYDWLYDQLEEDEEKLVRKALLARTRQVADHVIKNAKIHLFPYDSHAVRSVSAVLVPACIAMAHEEEEAREWLHYSIEFLSTVYTPWGDSQGGWAEGPHYWMTGMAYLIDAANLLKNYCGIDLYQRPFFQHTGDFPLYTKPPRTRRGTFGDDSTMGDLVCLKVGYNMQQFAGVTGNGAYQWYHEEVKRNDQDTEMAFYNWGWWDLNFDNLMFRHDYASIKAEIPQKMDKLRWFKGIGWAAIQHAYDNPDEHIHFVMKSSPYGSISHSHGDQNAFCMSAFGEDLAIQSGHYIAFNSSMHQDWRRQTRSKNAILINGNGQYAGKDKAQAMRSTGNILVAEEREDHCYIKSDATPAYQTLTPAVTLAEREFYFVRDSFFVIIDNVDADEDVDIDWLLHTNKPMQLGSNSFRYTGDRAGFYGQFIWSEAGEPTLSQAPAFEGVDPKEYEGLPVSSAFAAKFPKAKRHRIATLMVPYRNSNPKRIFNFLDDQGYDCDLYFTDDQENSFKITVPKLAKA